MSATEDKKDPASMLAELKLDKDEGNKTPETKTPESNSAETKTTEEVKELKNPFTQKKEDVENDAAEEKTNEVNKDDAKDERENKDTNLIKSEYEVKVNLADLQADPNSPLYSVKSFDELGLSPELLKGIYAMKFQKPSKIQERALPLLLSNPPRNMIAQSQSGTGKTAAFSLTMLSRVDETQNVPQAICLAPSRELARQTLEVIQEMGKYTKITTQLIVPDSFEKNTKINANVVVGTPGTLLDLIRRKLIQLQNVKIFVLDEADNMLDKQGLGDQCIRVKKFLPKDTQLVLFSATFADAVKAYAQRLFRTPTHWSFKEMK